MRKKTVALGSLVSLLCATQVVAGSCFYKSGFLAGGHVGASFGKGTFKSTYSLNPQVLQSPSTINQSKSKTAGVIGLLGGYRHIFNQGVTLGANLEMNALLSDQMSHQLSHQFPALPLTVPVTNRLKRNYSVIPSITIGKILCDRYLIVLGLGVGFTSFKQQVTNELNKNTQSSRSTKVGFVPSLGLEYAATQNISLTGNVSYEIYSNVKNSFNTGFGTGATYTTSIKPSYLTLKLGSVYRF